MRLLYKSIGLSVGSKISREEDRYRKNLNTIFKVFSRVLRDSTTHFVGSSVHLLVHNDRQKETLISSLPVCMGKEGRGVKRGCTLLPTRPRRYSNPALACFVNKAARK